MPKGVNSSHKAKAGYRTSEPSPVSNMCYLSFFVCLFVNEKDIKW